MQNDFFITIDKERLDLELLRSADDSLPRVIRQMNTSTPFVGLSGGKVVAVCLLEKRDDCHDIVNFAVAESERGKGFGREMIDYVIEYVRSNGGRYVEIGCPNTSFGLMAMYQKLGFRFYSAWPDYYMSDAQKAEVENSILIRDMVRFRADLNEKRLTTIGYDASGRT